MRLSTALALFLCSMNALAQLSVVEPATRAVLVDGHTTISLAFNNLGPQTVDVRVSLQWLSPDGQVDGKGQRDVTLPPGNSAVSIPHPLCDKCDPLVERLEYLVSPTSSNYTAFAPVSGRLSLPNIAKHAFALSVLTAGFPAPNQPFEVRVLAAHPLSGQPIPGVEVTSDQATAVTGEDGIALLHVTREPDDEGTIDVTGQIGDFKADAESTPLPNKKQQIRGYTDKPIYQPGQTMHLRILALDERGRAEEGREFELRIVDESDELNFNAKIKTSRFGIASTDWEIPQGVEPGRYTINLKTDETDRYFLHQVSIRRYELPSFRVAVAPDRPFYLINQPAHVEIRGEYLFRKPVSSGKVRIVKANEEDKAIAEGALDSHGRFSATLDTTAKLAASQKFEDHHYIAFLTDLSTNRTEQCKFDLRISRDPVHIYAIRQESNAAGRHLYITTYSPDGTPLRSQVEIGNAGSVLGRGRTNRFGLTRIDLPAAKPDDEAESLEIRATTDNGLRARMDLPSASGLPPYRREPTLIWLRTDRTLYRAGEAVKCVIGSAKPEHPVLLIAFNDKDQVVFTKSVRLNNGRVAVEIPYDKRFGRALNVGVATATARDTLPVRRVYFPGSTDLVIKATPAQPAYRPGDTATIQFEASSQAALGIAIVDQSVLERASTDSAFGRRHWFEGPDSRQVNLGGITEADLLNLDPASIHDVDLQLVAEVLSPDAGSLVNSARDVMKEIQEAFEKGVSKGLAPVVQAINEHYMETLEFPRDDASLHRIVGHALRQVQDPWMQAYYARFSISGPYAVVTFLSGGPDKLQSTADDLDAFTVRRKWFAPNEALMREALRGSDYPASPQAFALLLDSAGVRFEGLLDPWGSRVRAEITHSLRFREIRILSAGPDRAFGTADDFMVTEFRGSYFSASEVRIDRILETAPEFPATTDAFRPLLLQAGIDFDLLRDPWGHPYYLAFRGDESFTDEVELYTYAEYNRAPEERKQITPIKRTTRVAEIRSAGEDGLKGTYDDFAVATFRRVMRAPQPTVVAEKSPVPSVPLGGTGTIAGILLDQVGAVVPNAEVKLNDLYITRSDQEGKFVFSTLPPGKYRLSCSVQGFQSSVLEVIPVANANVTRVQMTLRVGSTAETIQVAAEAVTFNTESASVAAPTVALGPQVALSTPRVREYFPETLYWQPELITDNSGRASVRVKLADSVTTWHVAVIGSTLDGRIAEGRANVRAFQPFLVDLDVPQVLTVGDEISLPVPVRNYLDQSQKVALTAKLSPELRLLESIRQPDVVAASSSANALMSIRAETPAKKAPVRVTAIGRAVSDAVEKSTIIHPDGERRTTAVGSVVTAGESLLLRVSASAFGGSIQGQVKLYPSLLARILEAIEVLLEAPHGCGEQTISSTYPNLLLLKALREAGLADEQLSLRALKYLRAGYQRLLRYQNGDGGFTYWGHGDADVALTAYALTFLADAEAFIEVDEDTIARARKWLARQTSDQPATNGLRIHALADMRSGDSLDLDLQLGKMAHRAAEYGDPYALAAYALAAIKANKPELASPIIDQLRRSAQDERGGAWWALRANTPYHGWGRWGQVETTAMAVTALARWRKLGHVDAELDKLIDRGSLFLLRNTGERGAWATSQSTARALMALLDVWSGDDGVKPAQLDIRVNGSSAGKVTMPAGRTVQAPVIVDVSHLLRAGDNQISLAGLEARMQQVQVTAAWYEAWGPKRPDKDLEMQIRYSTLDAPINDPIACEVVISRPAFRGYGMMIANVGLPPGAEVDRGMLEEIIGNWQNGVDSYEVAPDQVTFYVWPRATDVKFRFLFRPRFSMKARAAQSVLYDFYNPDSNVVLAPETFVIRR